MFVDILGTASYDPKTIELLVTFVLSFELVVCNMQVANYLLIFNFLLFFILLSFEVKPVLFLFNFLKYFLCEHSLFSVPCFLFWEQKVTIY